MKICERCGYTCADNAVVCELCGAQLPAAPPPQPGYVQPPPYNQYAAPQGQPYPPPQQPYQPYQGYPQYQQPPYPYTQPAVKRKAPLVLGIIGVVFALLLPIVTYCCSIPGLVMANKDIQQGLDNRSARVLNIVAIVIAAINSIAGVAINLSSLM